MNVETIRVGISANDRRVLDLEETMETLDYRPRDNAENWYRE